MAAESWKERRIQILMSCSFEKWQITLSFYMLYFSLFFSVSYAHISETNNNRQYFR